MKNLLLLLSLSLISFGCKKTHTSYWQVNDESFSSNAVTFNYSSGGSVLSSSSQENGFSIMLIPGGELPKSGSSNINMPGPGSGDAHIIFYYQGKAYDTPTQPGSNAIQFSEADGKAILTIPPTWLKQWNATLTDSVLVQGKLSEP